MHRLICIFFVLTAAANALATPSDADDQLAHAILSDARLPRVTALAHELASTGLSAGDGYPNVWIRDLNTFIDIALDAHPHAEVRACLVGFLETQGANGSINDRIGPDDGSGWKNTVETDQETSLVQAVRRYVEKTGDTSILSEPVAGTLGIGRLDAALEFLYNERFSAAHGLIWGATTADWGDVQPEDVPGIHLSDKTHRSLDIYDNAMLALAIRDLVALLRTSGADFGAVNRWEERADALRANVRGHLWDGRKFIPHVYLEGSPFPVWFDESKIYFQGGTGVAIAARLLEPEEVQASFAAMVANKHAAGASSIGLTLHPPYPWGYFRNPILTRPHTYQNGGDWGWFGGRIITQMIEYGEVAMAYAEIAPMLDRVLTHGGFHEWWGLDGAPQGSGAYRGEAGVIAEAVYRLRSWAEERVAH